MNQHEALDLNVLKQLKTVSFEMLAFAETGDWKAVLTCDNTRLDILNNSSLNRKAPGSYGTSNSDPATQKARKALIKTILELDTKIQEIASKERKSVIDKQIRQKAQSAAQASYQQTLSTGTR